MNRHQLEWHMPVVAGDVMDVVLEPRAEMGCDGVSLISWEVWPE
jgi:hypothetical protein